MLRMILPQHPIARLYVGTIAVFASVGGAIALGEALGHRVFGR